MSDAGSTSDTSQADDGGASSAAESAGDSGASSAAEATSDAVRTSATDSASDTGATGDASHTNDSGTTAGPDAASDSIRDTATPSVGIVLLNFNGREQLASYLQSILDLEYDNYEVLVVDNDSEDGSVEFLREQYPEVDVVANDENVGFSRGHNIGAAELEDVDYLWLLNTDVEAEPTALARLVEHVEATPETGIVAPRLNYADDRSTIQSAGFDLDASGVPHPRDNGESEPSADEPYPVSYGTGAALLIDRDLWDELGGFDGQNFIYGDDTYLCVLAWLRGHRVEVVPDSVLYHEMGTSREKIEKTVAYHWGRSRVRWYLKLLQGRTILAGLPGFLLLFVKFLVADVLLRRSPKAAVYRLFGLFSPLLELRELYEQRRQIQRQRVRDDEAFLDGP